MKDAYLISVKGDPQSSEHSLEDHQTQGKHRQPTNRLRGRLHSRPEERDGPNHSRETQSDGEVLRLVFLDSQKHDQGCQKPQWEESIA